jgi:hypothetical protein
MPGDRFGFAAEAAQRPIARALRVGHRLQRGEGLRGDDEQRFRSIQIARRFDKIGAIDIGHEVERHGAVAVVLERLIRHHRPEIGAANADIDDVADALSGVSLPLAAADAVGKVGHLVEHGVNLGYDVLAVDDDGRASRCTQRDMQDRTIFGNVDFLAPEHRVDSLAQPGLLGELDEQAYRLVVDAILRVIQEDAGGLRRHPLATRWIAGEQVAQVPPPHRPIVIFESAPRPLSAR